MKSLNFKFVGNSLAKALAALELFKCAFNLVPLILTVILVRSFFSEVVTWLTRSFEVLVCEVYFFCPQPTRNTNTIVKIINFEIFFIKINHLHFRLDLF